MKIVSEETKRKISEALKAYHASRNSLNSRVERQAAKNATTFYPEMAKLHSKVYEARAALTPSRVDDVTEKLKTPLRIAKGHIKGNHIATKFTAKSVIGDVKKAIPAAKDAAKSLVGDFKSSARTAMQKALDSTTIDEKTKELYNKGKQKLTKKKPLPKSTKV
jgi:DNA-binding ferritin-like protein